MTSSKTYLITEEQFKSLLETKKQEKLISTQIIEEIRKKRSTLNEAELIEEGIVDTIKNYAKKGLLTTAVISTLLANNVNAQQLMAAGVPQDKIEMATGNSGQQTNSEVPTDKIEQRLIKIMKQNGLKGSLAAYSKLSPQQRQAVLKGIQSKIKSIDDVEKFNYASVGGWQKNQDNSPNAIQFDQKSQQVIRVDTVITTATVPLHHSFAINSATIQNPDSVRQQISSMINMFTEVDSIIVESSSSTLRNRGEFEGMTWQQSSQKRAEAIVGVINGIEQDLGGQGVNKKGPITAEKIQINAAGLNGDGTSGPKSPYEVDPQAVASYQQRNIDPKFWKSNSQEAPHQNMEEYDQHQYVRIVIKGRIVKTETEDVPSYRYIFLQAKKMGANIQVDENSTKPADISKCPVKFKAN